MLMKWMGPVVLAAVVMGISGCGTTEVVEPDQLSEKIGQGALVVDVRTRQEYAQGHFGGAINIPVDEIEQRLNELGPKVDPIVVYCQSGMRSARAKRILEAAGYKDVTNGGGLSDLAAVAR